MIEDRLEKALNTDQWNVNTLHDHLTMLISELDKRIDQRFAAQEAATKAAMLAAKEAVDKAEKLASTRADAQNEWRATLDDIVGRMLSKEEYNIAHENLVQRLNYENDIVSKGVGQRAGMAQTLTWVIAGSIAIVSLGFGLIEMFTH